jgi:GNAT superfamily N-acetyltransferase
MLTIRSCTPADHSQARTLLAAQLEEHDIPTDSLDPALEGALSDPSRALVLLAEQDGQPIGVAYLAFTWTLEHGGKSAWLEELYVAPPYRGTGVGTTLLQAALSEATARGCLAMDLEVETAHARAANLYRRTGFHPHTRSRWVKKLNHE